MAKRKADPGGERPAQGGRKAKALETRRRMLRAAYDLFCANGYAATTMDLIAERAEVAVQTLYFTFHTKAAILEECVGACIAGFERWDPRMGDAVVADLRTAFVEQSPWFPAFERARTQRDALAVFVDTSMDIFARVGPLVFVARAAEGLDPQVKRNNDVAEQRRVEGYLIVIEHLAARGGLRRGLTHQRANDIMLTLLGGETWHQLSVRRGWSAEQLRKWLVDVLAQQLLPS